MKKAIAVAALLVGGALLMGVDKRDASFQLVATISVPNADGGMAVGTVPAGSFIRVVCPYNANVTALHTDAGSACSINTCEHVNYLLGEKWNSQLTTTQNKVGVYASDAGDFTCYAYRALN